VRVYLDRAEPLLANLPVIAKAFANADGLSRFLLSTSLVQSTDSLAEFAKGFSQAIATSDFILVDKKIKGKGSNRAIQLTLRGAYADRYLRAIYPESDVPPHRFRSLPR
jgi:hypothetical protein